MSSLSEIRSNLERGENIAASLKSVVAILLKSSISDVLSQIPLQLFFNSFQYCVCEEDADLLLSILDKFLSSKTSSHNFTAMLIKEESLHELLVSGFSNPYAPVRIFVVGQMGRFFQSDDLLRVFFTRFLNVFAKPIFVASFKDKDLGVVKEAQKLVLNILCRSEVGINCLFSKDIMSEFQKVLLSEKNEILQMRYYDLFMTVASVSAVCFQNCGKSGVLDSFLQILDIDNVLTLLNVLEITKFFVSNLKKEKPVSYLTKLFKKIVVLYTEKYSNDPLVATYFISLIGVLKDLTEEFEVSEKLIMNLFRNMHSEDKKIVQVSLEVIGTLLGRSEELIEKLLKEKDHLEKYFEFLTSGDSTLKITFLYSVSSILNSESAKDEKLKVLYFSSGVNIVSELFEILKSPFDEQRIAVFNLMVAMSSFKWGVKEMLRFPTFWTFMTQRSTESEKKCLEVKYHVVERVAKIMKQNVKEFDNKILVEFLAFLRLGPFFDNDPSLKMKMST